MAIKNFSWLSLPKLLVVVGLLLGLGKPGAVSAQSVVLLTPTEHLFAGMGRSAGQALGNLAQIRGQAAAFERKIGDARTAFAQCYPKCSKAVKEQLGNALFEKDIYYLDQQTLRPANVLFGNGAEADFWHEAAKDYWSGIRGGDADGSIARECKTQFQNWTNAFMNALPKDNATARLNQKIRQAALQKTQNAFRPYHRCRDKLEISRAQKAGMFLDWGG
ncbi:hypothetical protein [Parasphingorhabdus sp.]|uniref:hypothetical protein n=1 Tax=Parasphingorhabdus sp. TaxID=2709688 RepID=UPI003A90549C